jgi:2'-5' RNA ligase
MLSKIVEEALNEAEKKPYNYGCMMLYYDVPEWSDYLDMIDEEDLYQEDNGQFGLEDEPHITVLYGLHSDEIDDEELFNHLQKFNPPKVSMSNISLFNNDNFDVVKFDVEGSELFVMNKTLTDNFPYSTDYPDYHPHSTIAYVKPGMGEKYVQQLSEPFVLQPNKLVYSKPDGSKITREL